MEDEPHFVIRFEGEHPVRYETTHVKTIPGFRYSEPTKLINETVSYQVGEVTKTGVVLEFHETLHEAEDRVRELTPPAQPDFDSSCQSCVDSNKRIIRLELAVKRLLENDQIRESRLNLLESCVNSNQAYEERIVPGLGMLIRKDYLERALSLAEPLETLFRILNYWQGYTMEFQELIWTEYTEEQKDSLVKLFLFVVSERHFYTFGETIDETSAKKEKSALKEKFQKKLVNMLRRAPRKKAKTSANGNHSEASAD